MGADLDGVQSDWVEETEAESARKEAAEDLVDAVEVRLPELKTHSR